MKNGPLLTVSFRPFRYNRLSFTHVNYGFLLLLIPALVQGTRLYGLYTLRIVAASIAACMLWDLLLEKLFRRSISIGDGSAAMTGMLLGMLLPPLTPWWILLIATGAAMFLGKVGNIIYFSMYSYPAVVWRRIMRCKFCKSNSLCLTIRSTIIHVIYLSMSPCR